MKPILRSCLILARNETHDGALEWFERPIVELYEWSEAIVELDKEMKHEVGRRKRPRK